MTARLITDLANQVPGRGRLQAMFFAGSYYAVFNPFYSLCSHMAEDIEEYATWVDLYPDVMTAANGGLYIASAIALPYTAAKLAEAFGSKKKNDPLFWIGKMSFTESELFTNIKITGAIGSGKTSSAIYPLLRQLLKVYRREDYEPENKAERYRFQKLGGLVMDVKGNFVESLICLMHEAGRNVLEDLVVVTPWSDYEYAEFEDPDTGFHWYVSARGGADEGSNELLRLAADLTMPCPETGLPDGENPIPLGYYLAEERELLEPISLNCQKTHQEYLSEQEFVCEGKDVHFLGWRKEGGRLRRIERTKADREIEFAVGADGQPIYADPPRTLRFKRVRRINNGLTFNICPAGLAPVELAARLVAMGKNSSGKGSTDSNAAFWDEACKKHLQWCAYLWREVNPSTDITAVDINRLTVSEEDLRHELEKLGETIDNVERKRDKSDNLTEKAGLSSKLTILKDMESYFEVEWLKMDSKTKSNLISTITNVFGPFMSDARLRQTFCSRSATNIRDIMQKGKVFTIYSPHYENAARIYGTSMKLEYQAEHKRRTAESNYNKTRFSLYLCDETQNFVTCGGNDPTSGDENFQALSRESKVCNIVATQMDSSITNVVGDKPADVYFGVFGTNIWYQNTDSKTNKRAAETIGKARRLKIRRQGQDIRVGAIFSKDGSSSKGITESAEYEDKDRFPTDAFSNLDVHECIIYNKGKKGRRAKAIRSKVAPDPVGNPAPDARNTRNDVLRWYFQAFIENQLAKTDQGFLVDHKKELAFESEGGGLSAEPDDVEPEPLAAKDLAVEADFRSIPDTEEEEEQEPLSEEEEALAQKIIDAFKQEEEKEGELFREDYEEVTASFNLDRGISDTPDSNSVQEPKDGIEEQLKTESESTGPAAIDKIREQIAEDRRKNSLIDAIVPVIDPSKKSPVNFEIPPPSKPKDGMREEEGCLNKATNRPEASEGEVLSENAVGEENEYFESRDTDDWRPPIVSFEDATGLIENCALLAREKTSNG